MSPYFRTQQDAEDFHDYISPKGSTYSHLMGAEERKLVELTRTMGMGHGSSMDLRLYRLDAVTKMAEDFDRDCRTGLGKESSLILKIKGETLREFYGFDMHSRVGYEEPESEEDQEDNNVVGCRESQESEPTEASKRQRIDQ